MIQVYAELAFEKFAYLKGSHKEHALKGASSIYNYNVFPLVYESYHMFDGIYTKKSMKEEATLKEAQKKLSDDIEHNSQAIWYAKKDGIPFEIELTWTRPESPIYTEENTIVAQEYIKIRSIPNAPEGTLMFYVQCAIDICTNYFIREFTAERVKQ